MKLAIVLTAFVVVLAVLIYSQESWIINKGNSQADSPSETVLPVKLHIVKDSSGLYTSHRNRESVDRLLNGANRIWSQAAIRFEVKDVVITEVGAGAIPNAINGNYNEIYKLKDFDNEKINIYLTQSLNGINGLALPAINSALLSDYTTVNDYRTLAHELGHLLGLGHLEGDNMLMARGRNGEQLSQVGIMEAREGAVGFLGFWSEI